MNSLKGDTSKPVGAPIITYNDFEFSRLQRKNAMLMFIGILSLLGILGIVYLIEKNESVMSLMKVVTYFIIPVFWIFRTFIYPKHRQVELYGNGIQLVGGSLNFLSSNSFYSFRDVTSTQKGENRVLKLSFASGETLICPSFHYQDILKAYTTFKSTNELKYADGQLD